MCLGDYGAVSAVGPAEAAPQDAPPRGPRLTPVAGNPFAAAPQAAGPKLVPVAGNPFAAAPARPPIDATPANPGYANRSVAGDQGLPVGSIDPRTGQPVEKPLDFAGPAHSFLGAFDTGLGDMVAGAARGLGNIASPGQFLVSDAINEAAGKPVAGIPAVQERYNHGAPGAQEHWYERGVAAPPPGNAFERVADSSGNFLAKSLPFMAGPMIAATDPASRFAVNAADVAAGQVAPTIKNFVNSVADTIAAHPVAALGAETYGNAAAGGGGQIAAENFGEPYRGMGELAGGLAAPFIPYVSPTYLGVKATAAATKAGARYLPASATREARQAEELAFSNREGKYADPNVPAPAQPGFFEGMRDQAAAARQKKALDVVGPALEKATSDPMAQQAMADAEQAKTIPGFQPSIAKQTNNQPLLNAEKEFADKAQGSELMKMQAQRDSNAAAINKFASEQGPAPGVAQPEDRVQAALQQQHNDALAAAEKDVQVAQQPIQQAAKDLPEVNVMKAGEDLRSKYGAAQDVADKEVQRLRSEIDPEKTYRGPTDQLRTGIEDALKARNTDLTNAEIPPKVREILGNTAPTTKETPASSIVDQYGNPLSPGKVEQVPSTTDVDSLIQARQDVGKRMRELGAAQDARSQDNVRVLGDVRDQLDAEIDRISKAGVPGVSDRLAAFNEHYKTEYAPNFRRDLGKDINRYRPDNSNFIKPEDIPTRLLGPNNASEMAQFNRVHGQDPEARKIVTNMALDDIRRTGVKDGMLDEKAVQKWMDSHSRVLDEAPWLRQELQSKDPSQLYQKLGAAETNRQNVVKSDLAKQLGGNPDAVVDTALKDFRQARVLKDRFKADPDADKALAQSVWDRATAAGKGEDTLLDAGKMRKFMDENRRSLDILLSPEHMKNLDTIVKAAEIEGRLPRPKGTAEQPNGLGEKALGGLGISVPGFLNRLWGVQTGRTSEVWMGLDVGVRALNKMTQTEVKRAWKEALTNNKVAEIVAAAARNGKATPMQTERLRSYILAAPTTGAPADQQKQPEAPKAAPAQPPPARPTVAPPTTAQPAPSPKKRVEFHRDPKTGQISGATIHEGAN